MQHCEHSLIFGETKNKYICFVCIDCLKVEFVTPITDKDIEEFKCNCNINEISNNLKFNFKGGNNYIYCHDCKKILKE